MRTLSCAALLAATLLAVVPATAQQTADRIDDLLQAYVALDQFSGTALVAKDGEVIFEKGYGLADVEWDIPNTPDTKFRLGSITKQFTAAIILQLAEEGKLDLQDPISKHLPWYPAEVGDRVTIHQLLNHTSGIPSYTSRPEFFPEQSRDPYSPRAFVDTFSGLPLDFEPGTAWSYNNSGYFLLGVLIEEITGQSYEDALQARIFDPLGMADSGYDHHDRIMKKRAAGYEWQGMTLVNAAYLDMSLPYAAGSLYSTVDDLYKWDRALYGDEVLSEASKQKIFSAQYELPDRGGAYTYGFILADWPVGPGGAAVATVQHGGGINGFNTLLVRVPEDEHLVVLLNNTGGTNLSAMAQGILRILYGAEAGEPQRPIARVLLPVVAQEGADAAAARYRALKAESPDGYDFAEDQLNTLGYELLRRGRTEDAVRIFALNVEAYPDGYNTYDSLGEAYMVQGDTAQAVANYLRSLELNPGNENARDMLREMGVDADEHLAAPAELSEETLDGYLGRYQLAPNFVITVTRDGTQLQAQATGQPQFDLFPSAEDEFYLKVVDAQITFNRSAAGDVEGLTLHQGGRDMPAQKIE